MSNLPSNQCGVKGCKNTRDQGAFVGPFCAPCDHDLRTGNFQFGTSVVYEQAREVERLTLHSDVAQKHIDAVTDRYNLMRAALLYWRNECSGREPSLSVFERMVDRALSGDSSAPETKTRHVLVERDWLETVHETIGAVLTRGSAEETGPECRYCAAGVPVEVERENNNWRFHTTGTGIHPCTAQNGKTDSGKT